MSVEQNPTVLNEIADAWFEDAGDAQKAWKVIARCVDEGRDFPGWVRRYLRWMADDPPLPQEAEERPLKRYYDPIDVYVTVAKWRMVDGKKPSLQECFARYINERLCGRGEEETIKTTYYAGQKIVLNELALEKALIERDG